MKRRTLLTAAGLVAAGCAPQDLALAPAAWVGAGHARGHRLRNTTALPTATVHRRAGALVVGAGVAGLAAARGLQRQGVDDVAVLELEDHAGGNSRGTQLGGMACPLGAHYLPLPAPASDEVSEWLHEVGLLRQHLGRTVADERHLCHSPQERLFVDGVWAEGLLPPAEPGSATAAQYRRFAQAVRTEQQAAAGRFALPAHRSRWDAGLAALETQTFAAWLGAQGFTDERLRWYLDYCCRDDYGAGLDTVSAWAGIHYFASRHGFHAPGEGAGEREGVFTWPDGNAWLVRQLAAPLGSRVHTGRTVLRVRETRQGVEVLAWDEVRQKAEQWSAPRAVLATPLFVAARVLENPPDALRQAAALLQHAPWVVANVQLDAPLLDRPGAPPSWDNVRYGSTALGYVDAMHQSLRPHAGPTVLTAYWALPISERAALLAATPEGWRDRVLAELATVHPDIHRRARAVQLMRWGHAMAIPRPGTVRHPALQALRTARGRVRLRTLTWLAAACSKRRSRRGARPCQRLHSVRRRPEPGPNRPRRGCRCGAGPHSMGAPSFPSKGLIMSMLRLPGLLFACALVVAGCSGKSEQEAIDAAKALLAKSDAKGAALELKASLADNPNSARSRAWLGRALLAGGDPVGAAVELEKAQELQAPPEDVLPHLARALLDLHDERRLVSQFNDTKLGDPQAQADLLTTLAIAFQRLGQDEQAANRVDTALRLAPGFAPATVVLARQRANAGDVDAALSLLADVLKREPGLETAGLLKGELLWVRKGQLPEAEAAYKAVLAAHPNHVGAHTSLIAVYSFKKDLEAARAQLAALEKAAPTNPETIYHRAQFAYVEKDYGRARELAESLMKVLGDDTRLLELAGAIELKSGRYVQAESYLSRVVKARPGLIRARHLLAQAYLRSGQPAKVLELLQGQITGKQVDGQSLALTGEAYLQKGDARRAEALLNQAAKLAPKDMDVRVAQARMLSARGDQGAATATLEAAAAGDDGPRGDLALVSARMRAGDLPGALKSIDALQKKLPKEPLPDFLRGLVLQQQRNNAGAAAAFEEALKKQPEFFDAVAMLARMDLAAGKPELARQRFEAVLKRQPNHAMAQFALAELEARSGGSNEAVGQRLRAAVKANPLEPRVYRVLVQHLLGSGDAAGAVTAAQSAVAALPNDYELMALLGSTQLAAKDTQQALATLKKLTGSRPAHAPYQVLLAQALSAQNDQAAAKAALNRALQLSPGLVTARRGLVAVALAEKRPEDAMAQVKLLQKESPKDAGGFELEGDVAAARGTWDVAATAYRAALQRDASSDVALRLHNALLRAGKQGEAEQTLAALGKARPDDPLLAFYMGDRAMAAKDYAGAEGHYQRVLKVQPENALALNNLAWLSVQQGKAGARSLAEKANALMPERAPLLDTLALTLAQEKKWPEAVEVQKRAVSRSPQDIDLQLTLARYLIQAGRKGDARGVLESLAARGAEIKQQADVAQLLQSAR